MPSSPAGSPAAARRRHSGATRHDDAERPAHPSPARTDRPHRLPGSGQAVRIPPDRSAPVPTPTRRACPSIPGAARLIASPDSAPDRRLGPTATAAQTGSWRRRPAWRGRRKALPRWLIASFSSGEARHWCGSRPPARRSGRSRSRSRPGAPGPGWPAHLAWTDEFAAVRQHQRGRADECRAPVLVGDVGDLSQQRFRLPGRRRAGRTSVR